MRFIGCVLLFLPLISCSSVQTLEEKYQHQCSGFTLSSEIVECYNNISSLIISRQITMATRRFTDGDFPHTYQMLIQLQVDKSGSFSVDSILRSSQSRLLDKKILQVLGDIKKIYVPKGELFFSSGYERLKLLIKPARTPILNDEQLVDNNALIIYVRRATR